jgi:hypothetical protein
MRAGVRGGVRGFAFSIVMLIAGPGLADGMDSGAPPTWCGREFKRHGLQARLQLHEDVTPRYQRGDFDGDGRIDCAVMVQDRKTKDIGVAVFHRRGGKPYILGAGQDFGNGGPNWQWLDAWSLVPGEGIPERKAEGRDVLYVQKLQSASAYIYWDGSQYVWLQASD